MKILKRMNELKIENNRECPFCHETLPVWKCLDFHRRDFKDSHEHYVICHHCRSEIRIKKLPYSPWLIHVAYVAPLLLMLLCHWMFGLDGLPWLVYVLMYVIPWLAIYVVLARKFSEKIELERPE